jgi:L-lactate dehydrogenase complex protein LldG
VLSAAEARERVVSLARKLEARSAAIGGGVTMDLAPIAKGLEAAGIAVISPRKVKDSERLEMRASIAKCDLAVVEADYAIAATGTCAVVSAPERPGSLTLLPPVNIILVNTDRILPDLAATIGALGPTTVAANRMALISGPSRTADIEKMIVLGVHGPHRLCACAVWNPEGAAPRQ